jgi:sialate O-acetylesterase
LHPLNKKGVADRLAAAARGLAYGEDLIYSGPVAKTAVIDVDTISITFEHTAGALAVHGSTLGGFTVNGEPARASAERNVVYVKVDNVHAPYTVCYAMENAPQAANLYNAAGWPAMPFKLQV